MDADFVPDQRLYKLGYSAGLSGMPSFVGRSFASGSFSRRSWLAGWSAGRAASNDSNRRKERLNSIANRTTRTK